jgi:DNA-binding CsgD family transcriptional regulator
MNNFLEKIIKDVSDSSSEKEVRSACMDNIGKYFGAKHWGMYLFDEDYSPLQVDIKGLPDSFVDHYEQIGRGVDPILNYVIERHFPTHQKIVLTEESWKKSVLYRHVSSRYDHEHIMTGPIIKDGKVFGTLNLARGKNSSSFNFEDILEFSVFCTHVSISLLNCHSIQHHKFTPTSNTNLNCLSMREQQIAFLVATGLKNIEIGKKIRISENGVKQALKRIFYKLDISSRSQMTAKLFLSSGLQGERKKRGR